MIDHPFNSLIQLHCSNKCYAQINSTVCEMQVGGRTCKESDLCYTDGFFFSDSEICLLTRVFYDQKRSCVQ